MPLPEVPPAPEAPPTPRAVRVEPTPPPELAPIFASPPPPPPVIPDTSGDGAHAGKPAGVFAEMDGDTIILGALDRSLIDAEIAGKMSLLIHALPVPRTGVRRHRHRELSFPVRTELTPGFGRKIVTSTAVRAYEVVAHCSLSPRLAMEPS